MNDTLRPGTFFGDAQSWREADAILSEVRHYVGAEIGPHVHEAPYFGLVLDGSYTEIAGDITIDCAPLTVIFHTERTEHSTIIGPNGCTWFFVELSPRWMAIADDLGRSTEHIFELHGGDVTWLTLRLYHEFLARTTAPAITVEPLLLELCTYLSNQPPEHAVEPVWLASVDRIVQSEFRTGISAHALAKEVGVNASHLCRVFRKFRGRSLGDYALGLRIQLVCQQLVESSNGLGEIALEAGFTDQSHMTRTFKYLTGVTPGAYRQRARREQ